MPLALLSVNQMQGGFDNEEKTMHGYHGRCFYGNNYAACSSVSRTGRWQDEPESGSVGKSNKITTAPAGRVLLQGDDEPVGHDDQER